MISAKAFLRQRDKTERRPKLQAAARKITG